MAWRCDEFVPYMRSEELKAMARMLGGSGQLRKDDGRSQPVVQFAGGALVAQGEEYCGGRAWCSR